MDSFAPFLRLGSHTPPHFGKANGLGSIAGNGGGQNGQSNAACRCVGIIHNNEMLIMCVFEESSSWRRCIFKQAGTQAGRQWQTG